MEAQLFYLGRRWLVVFRHIDTGDPCLCAVPLMCNIGLILFVCVYMPNDTGDYKCVENYIDTCARLSAIFAECEAVHLVVVGDFNTHFGCGTFESFARFFNDSNLCWTDHNRLTNACIYFNDAGNVSLWIDHVLSSKAVDNLVYEVDVLLDFMTSDHKLTCCCCFL
jgi:exonuclease III